jgi:hypothetical protein
LAGLKILASSEILILFLEQIQGSHEPSGS